MVVTCLETTIFYTFNSVQWGYLVINHGCCYCTVFTSFCHNFNLYDSFIIQLLKNYIQIIHVEGYFNTQCSWILVWEIKKSCFSAGVHKISSISCSFQYFSYTVASVQIYYGISGRRRISERLMNMHLQISKIFNWWYQKKSSEIKIFLQ